MNESNDKASTELNESIVVPDGHKTDMILTANTYSGREQMNKPDETELSDSVEELVVPDSHKTDMISTADTCSDREQVNKPDEAELSDSVEELVVPDGHKRDTISTANTCSDIGQANKTELSESVVVPDGHATDMISTANTYSDRDEVNEPCDEGKPTEFSNTLVSTDNCNFANDTNGSHSPGHFLKRKLDLQRARLLVQGADCMSTSSSSVHDDSDKDSNWNPLEEMDDVSSGSYSDDSEDVSHVESHVDFVENSVDDMSMEIPIYANIQLKAAPCGVQDPMSRTHMFRETVIQRMEKVRAGKKSKTSTEQLKTSIVSKTTNGAPEDPFTFQSITSATSFTGLDPSGGFPAEVQSVQDEADGPSKSCK